MSPNPSFPHWRNFSRISSKYGTVKSSPMVGRSISLEQALCEYLGVEHIALCTNGTIGLITALQALRITGEVITTPYSFVATTHSLLWNSIKPVFVDINPGTLNIEPDKIEAAITPQTTAIMPVHCYGHPCDVEAIQKIADIYNLKIIYDAAAAFGVQDDARQRTPAW